MTEKNGETHLHEDTETSKKINSEDNLRPTVTGIPELISKIFVADRMETDENMERSNIIKTVRIGENTNNLVSITASSETCTGWYYCKYSFFGVD